MLRDYTPIDITKIKSDNQNMPISVRNIITKNYLDKKLNDFKNELKDELKEELFEIKDEIVKEIKNMREEFDIHQSSHRRINDELQDQSKQIKKLRSTIN